MMDKLFIKKNSNQIIEYLKELEAIVDKSDDEIKSNSLLYHTAERLLQLIVDSMIDINIHLIKEGKLNVPDDLQSTFLTLADNKIIPSEFADKIAPVVGVRNRLVHRYETLDKNIFITNLKKNFSDFKQYLIYIEKII